MAAEAMPPPPVNKAAWARQVALSAGVPEDLACEALDRAMPALIVASRDGPRRRAHRSRRALIEAIAEARRLWDQRIADAVRLPAGCDRRLSESAARELYGAIVAEVPEVSEGVVRIVRVVRARRLGAKVAVCGRLPGFANVGALIGEGGRRIRAVREHVWGERVDVVAFHCDLAAFALAALRPGEVVETWEEGSHAVTVTCGPDAMAGVIGTEGLNVVLAGTLVRARITVVSAPR